MSRISNLVKRAEKSIDNEATKITRAKNEFKDNINRDIQTIKTDAQKVGSTIKSGAEKTASAIKTEAQQLPSQLKSAGSALEAGALEVGKTVSALEADFFPSSSKIILETGLVVAGIAVVGLLVLKFV